MPKYCIATHHAIISQQHINLRWIGTVHQLPGLSSWILSTGCPDLVTISCLNINVAEYPGQPSRWLAIVPPLPGTTGNLNIIITDLLDLHPFAGNTVTYVCIADMASKPWKSVRKWAASEGKGINFGGTLVYHYLETLYIVAGMLEDLLSNFHS